MLKFLSQENADNIDFVTNLLSLTNLPHLVGTPIRLVGGSKSFAYRINDYVVRFPKAEIIWQSQQLEAKISNLLQENLPDKLKNKITDIVCYSKLEYPFTYHKIIKGKICDNIRGETEYNTCYANLSKTQKTLLAEEIAELLAAIHSISTDITNTMADNWNFTQKPDFDYNLCKSALLKYSDNKINLDDFKCNIDNNMVFAHNDMSGSNIILDETQENALQGVLDFGNAGIMPQINDFLPFYKIDRHLAKHIIYAYNQISNIKINQSQADYLTLSYLGYIIYNQEQQGNAPFNFLLIILKNIISDLQNDKNN